MAAEFHLNLSYAAIIPAHNNGTSLGIAVESALAQVPPPAEVIVIDDGSTDNTAEVARSYADRVTLVQQQNQGQGAARNSGLAKATSDYAAFLDADDHWLPGFAAACLEFFAQHPQAIGVSTGRVIRKWGQPDRVWSGPPEDGLDQGPRLIENFFEFWGRNDHIHTSTAMIRRSAFDQAGGMRADLRISQDLEYWAYLATFGPWGLVPTPLGVGDPMSAIIDRSWLEKYLARRRLCPTVESWEERIVPRLQERDWPGFRQARGRVAAGYAISKVIAGNRDEARHIIEKYGDDMPAGWFTRLARRAHRFGSLSWLLSCRFVQGREYLKSYWIQQRALKHRSAQKT